MNEAWRTIKNNNNYNEKKKRERATTTTIRKQRRRRRRRRRLPWSIVVVCCFLRHTGMRFINMCMSMSPLFSYGTATFSLQSQLCPFRKML